MGTRLYLALSFAIFMKYVIGGAWVPKIPSVPIVMDDILSHEDEQ